ncbi:MAG: GGDEF domain-containing protein [Rhodospirillales bacterium]|nr:GGDEF domain-containing protein [Rhodospirillales bacterium]
MIELDVLTLSFTAMIISALLAGAMFILWRLNPEETCARFWAVGAALLSAGLLLVAFRQSTTPFFGLLVPPVLSTMGVGAFIVGIGVFVGRRIPPWTIGAIGSAVFLLLVVLVYVYPTPHVRVGLITLVYCALSLWAAVLLAFEMPTGAILAQLFPTAAFWVFGIVSLYFGVAALYQPTNIGSLAGGNILPGFYLAAILTLTCLIFGFAAMINSRLYQKLAHIARHDPLTGVYNRRALEEAALREIARCVRHGYPLSVLMMDLDFFKKINDEHGHDAGDAVLKAFAATVAEVLRTDDILGRFGGEEFLALLPYSDRSAARTGAERIRGAVASMEVRHEGQKLDVTVSIGVAELVEPGKDWGTTVSLADTALYKAKEGGRNRVAG